MTKPFQYTKPSTYTTAIVDGNNGSIRFNNSDVAQGPKRPPMCPSTWRPLWKPLRTT